LVKRRMQQDISQKVQRRGTVILVADKLNVYRASVIRSSRDLDARLQFIELVIDLLLTPRGRPVLQHRRGELRNTALAHEPLLVAEFEDHTTIDLITLYRFLEQRIFHPIG